MNKDRASKRTQFRDVRKSSTSFSFLITIPVIVTIVLGLIGWSLVAFNRNDPIRSIVNIVVLTLTSFNLSTDYKSITEQDNWFIVLSALLGSVTTFAGVISFAFAFSRERLLRFRARYIWSRHAVVIGDTLLARRLTAWFSSNGHLAVRIVEAGEDNRNERALPVGFEVSEVVAAARAGKAKLIVVDLGTDSATLAFGQGILLAMREDRADVTVRRSRGPGNTRLALKVEDQILSDQFLEFSERLRTFPRSESENERLMRPIIFDEFRALARYVLARHPLFVAAQKRQQERVHAVIFGANDLGERLLDQILLTSITTSLDVPTVTILDRDAHRREREFRARRPGVAEQLPIQFIEFDIDIDLSSSANRTQGLTSLLSAANKNALTAIYVAFVSESDSLRAALLLRRHQERTGELGAPIFYYQKPSAFEKSFMPISSREPYDLVAMQAPLDVLVQEILDPYGHEDLARALHEQYRKGSPSAEADLAWEKLPDSLRRANVRAADQLPALLWSIGVQTAPSEPGELPQLDATAYKKFMESTMMPDLIERLAKLEHERWMIERKLDGWSFSARRDDQRRRHPLLLPWDELRKSPEAISKDVEQVVERLRYLSQLRRGSSDTVSF